MSKTEKMKLAFLLNWRIMGVVAAGPLWRHTSEEVAITGRVVAGKTGLDFETPAKTWEEIED